MAIPNRWAVREAAEASFYKVNTNELVVSLKTLKMTEITTTGETTYAMGGRGNAKLVGFSGNREARVTLQDAIFDNKALEMLTGNEILTNQARTRYVTDTITVGENGAFTLSDASYDGNIEVAGMTVPVTDGAVTSSSVPVGTYTVAYQTAVTGASVMTVTSKDFAGTFKLVVDVVVRDLDTGTDYYGQFIAPKVQVENEFTFSFSPDGDPSVLDIPIEILKATNSDNMYEFLLFDNEA